MNQIKIYNYDFFYHESNDPVVGVLKQGQLFGLGNYLTLKESIVDEGGWIIDCGAHIGTFGFVGAIEQQKMLLIEAANDNIECLKATFKPFNNVVVEQQIILDKIQNCNFESTSGPFGSAAIDSDGSRTSETLDNLCNKHKIDKVSAIKIDIEGYEEEALLGSQQILARDKPVLLLEINGHCLRLRKQKPQQILKQIYELGYVGFLKNNQSLIPIQPDKIFPFCVIDILCIHKDKLHKYIGNIHISQYLNDKNLEDIKNNNYSNSNDDCKRYFDSISDNKAKYY